MEMLTPDRAVLVEKINSKLSDMTDDELRELAKEVGAEEVIEDADKAVSKELADAVMSKPVVDTGVLAGPIGGLKSFLLKSRRDKEAK